MSPALPSQSEPPLVPKTFHPFSPDVIALLMPFSVFGVLARLGLTALTTYNGQSIFALIYSQALGCFVMGFCLALKDPFSRYYPPAYTALTSGFCGSLTTFSSWQLDIYKSWISAGGDSRSGLSDAIDGICKIVFTVSVSLASLQYGTHVARLAVQAQLFPTLSPPGKLARVTVMAISVCLYAATLPTFFLLPRAYRPDATAAMLFSFPGTLTRYVLGILLNPVVPAFPLGTFAANMLGTALLSAFHSLQSISNHPVSPASCDILQGLADGYCGCLTTISTFFAEVWTLKNVGHRYRYALVTGILGQVIVICIFGGPLWGGKVSTTQTCLFD